MLYVQYIKDITSFTKLSRVHIAMTRTRLALTWCSSTQKVNSTRSCSRALHLPSFTLHTVPSAVGGARNVCIFNSKVSTKPGLEVVVSPDCRQSSYVQQCSLHLQQSHVYTGNFRRFSKKSYSVTTP